MTLPYLHFAPSSGLLCTSRVQSTGCQRSLWGFRHKSRFIPGFNAVITPAPELSVAVARGQLAVVQAHTMLEFQNCDHGEPDVLLRTEDMPYIEVYKILTAAVAPRPIAWAGTRSRDGINNLAPFSFYNAFSSNPPIVGFSCIPRLDGRNKDTLQNVIDTECFTLSCVSRFLAEAMSRSAALMEPGEDEFPYAQVTPVQATSIDAPYVGEALVVFECRLNQIVSFGDLPGSGNLVLGEITHIHLDDEIALGNGRLDFEKLDPIGRLAGNWYSTIADRFEMARG